VSADPATFELAGQHFVVPTLVAGINDADPGARLVAGVANSGSVAHGAGHAIAYSFAPGAVDLSFARSGRCPILLEHARAMECLLGMVTEAWADEDGLRFAGRLAEGGWADRVWSLLRGGFPLSVSLGARIEAVEPLGPAEPGEPGPRRFRVTRWKLLEVSICTFGKDEEAHVACLDTDPEMRERLAERAKEAAADARLRMRQALHLDRWERWATAAGVAIAARLGADPDLVCDVLDAEVRRHCERLQAELAA
jgi:HK97 family phage prohead protease